MLLLLLIVSLCSESVLLMSTLGGLYRRTGELGRSSDMYRAAIDHIESGTDQYPQFSLMMNYELATNLFFQDKWDDAIPLIEMYLQRMRHMRCLASRYALAMLTIAPMPYRHQVRKLQVLWRVQACYLLLAYQPSGQSCASMFDLPIGSACRAHIPT
jgi:hypothetical protein